MRAINLHAAQAQSQGGGGRGQTLALLAPYLGRGVVQAVLASAQLQVQDGGPAVREGEVLKHDVVFIVLLGASVLAFVALLFVLDLALVVSARGSETYLAYCPGQSFLRMNVSMRVCTCT